jgi:hypothetical protein
MYRPRTRLRRASVLLLLLVFVSLITAACGQPVAESPDDRPEPDPPPTAAASRFPTARPSDAQVRHGITTLLHLSGILDVRIAVHPTQSWPAVGASHRVFDIPIQAYYRVFHPTTNAWGDVVGLDTGVTENGDDPNASNLVAITGEQTVHAVWGPADATDGVYHAISTDRGVTWGEPQLVAAECWPHDLMGHVDGTVVMLARCGYPPYTTELLTYDPARGWQQTAVLPFEAGTGMDMELIAVGDELHAVVWQSGRTLSLRTIRLADGAQISHHTPSYPAATAPLWGWKPNSVAYVRLTADDTGAIIAELPSVTFAWGGFERAAIYAIHSFDGGLTWEPVELVAGGGEGYLDPLQWPVPFYDPLSDSLLIIYSCCTGGVQADAPEQADRTHRLVWRHLDGARTWPEAQTSWTAPRELATGALQLRVGRGAQAVGSRTGWLAWTEHDGRVRARTIAIGDLLPPQAYPPDDDLPPPGLESTPVPFRDNQKQVLPGGN